MAISDPIPILAVGVAVLTFIQNRLDRAKGDADAKWDKQLGFNDAVGGRVTDLAREVSRLEGIISTIS